jgi:monoamine oxidase
LNPPIFGGTSFTDLSIQQSWYPSDNARRHRDFTGRSQYMARNPKLSEHRGVFTGAYMWGSNAENFARLSEAKKRQTVIREVAQLHDYPEAELDRVTLNVISKVWENGFTYYRAEEHEQCHLDLQEPLGAPGVRPRVFFAGEYLGVVHGWMVSAMMPALKAVKDVLSEVEKQPLSPG